MGDLTLGAGLIPPPVQLWFGVRCPLCQRRVCPGLFTTMLAYKVHYLAHAIENLERHVDVLAKGGNPRPWDGYQSGPLRTLIRRPDD